MEKLSLKDDKDALICEGVLHWKCPLQPIRVSPVSGFVVLVNASDADFDASGYVIQAASGDQRFSFPTDTIVGPGCTLTIWASTQPDEVRLRNNHPVSLCCPADVLVIGNQRLILMDPNRREIALIPCSRDSSAPATPLPMDGSDILTGDEPPAT